jgi:hypothetical protein
LGSRPLGTVAITRVSRLYTPLRELHTYGDTARTCNFYVFAVRIFCPSSYIEQA